MWLDLFSKVTPCGLILVNDNFPPPVSDHQSQPRSQGSLLPTLRSERGDNPGNEVAPVFGFWAVATSSSLGDKTISLLLFTPSVYVP